MSFPPHQHWPKATEAHRGALILVLGILGIVFCQILGPIAWILGRGDLKKMDYGEMDPSGRDLTQAGTICGIVGTVIMALWVLAGLAYFGFIVLFMIGIMLSA